jgi:hypothetical protein
MDDLITALQLMARKSQPHSPTHCEHDELTVMVDPELFTAVELAHLDELGFFDSGEGTFKSFRFGSA